MSGFGQSRVVVRPTLLNNSSVGMLTGNGAPSTVPDGTRVKTAYLDLTNGDVYELGADMQWVKLSSIAGAGTSAGLNEVNERLEALESSVGASPAAAKSIAIDSEGNYYINLTDTSVTNVGTIALDDEGNYYIQIGS